MKLTLVNRRAKRKNCRRILMSFMKGKETHGRVRDLAFAIRIPKQLESLVKVSRAIQDEDRERYLRHALSKGRTGVTYRELHEDAAGYGLDQRYFAAVGIDPDAPVTCNCIWNGGHDPNCDIVAARAIITRRNEGSKS